MKILSRIVLFLFISFQFAPSFLVLLEKGNDYQISSVLFEDDEEDINKQNKENKEIKIEFLVFSDCIDLCFNEDKTTKIEYIYIYNKYSIYNAEILLPPKLV